MEAIKAGLDERLDAIKRAARETPGGLVAVLVEGFAGCSICRRKVVAKGLCNAHYQRQLRHGAPTAGAPERNTNHAATCEAEGCDRPHFAKGLCEMHYARMRTHGDPSIGRKPPRTCVVEGCTKRAPHKGSLCAMHHIRLKKHGDVNHMSRRADGEGTILDGYKLVFRPNHPNASTNGQILEHRLVMAELLGRPLLPNENVHHRNGRRLDNRPENLELWVTSQPSGQRVADLLTWARSIVERYAGTVVDA